MFVKRLTLSLAAAALLCSLAYGAVSGWSSDRASGDAIIITIAGTGASGYNGDNIPAKNAQLAAAVGDVAYDADGNLYVADDFNNRVRRIDTSGTITTFAGTGVAGYTGDNGPATNAKLFSPRGVAVDSLGNVYIADRDNSAVRKVSSGGTITTFHAIAGPTRSSSMQTTTSSCSAASSTPSACSAPAGSRSRDNSPGELRRHRRRPAA